VILAIVKPFAEQLALRAAAQQTRVESHADVAQEPAARRRDPAGPRAELDEPVGGELRHSRPDVIEERGVAGTAPVSLHARHQAEHVPAQHQILRVEQVAAVDRQLPACESLVVLLQILFVLRVAIARITDCRDAQASSGRASRSV